MRKAEYKRMRGVKENYVQDRLRLKRIFCTSIKHVRWMKRYINRAPRHKEKRGIWIMTTEEISEILKLHKAWRNYYNCFVESITDIE
jgi:hypothetical protein